MKWLWIDPGETVGWARGHTEPESNTTIGCFFNENDPIPPPRDLRPRLVIEEHGQTALRTFAMKLVDAARDYDLIGYESYQIRQRDAQAHVGSSVPTLQLVGMIRLCAWLAQQARGDGTPVIISQPPKDKGTGKAAMSNYLSDAEQLAILKALGGPHDEGHWGDAALQAVAWYHRRPR